MLLFLMSILTEAVQLVKIDFKKNPFNRKTIKMVLNEKVDFVGTGNTIKKLKKHVAKGLTKKRKNSKKLRSYAKRKHMRRVYRPAVDRRGRNAKVLSGKLSKPITVKGIRFFYTIQKRSKYFIMVVFKYNRQNGSHDIVKIWRITRQKDD